MTSASAMTQFIAAKQKRQFHHVKVRRFGDMVTPKLRGTIAWENLRRIRKVGRKTWKHESGYHRRSLAETTMFRFKTIFGGKLRSRKFENQAVELFLQCAALNRMIQVGLPCEYPR